jgi:hypothetical protein
VAVAAATPAAPRLPAPARLYVAAVCAAGAVALVVRAVDLVHAPSRTFVAAAAILVASVAADRFTLSVPHGGEE